MADSRPTFEDLTALPPTAAPATPATSKAGRVAEAEASMPGVLGSVTRGAGAVADTLKGAGEAVLPIPKSVPEAAFIAATALAGPARLLPYVARLPMPLLRMILGAAGQGAATAAQGEGFAKGATQGALAGGVGELVGAAAKPVLGLAAKGVEKLPDVGARMAAMGKAADATALNTRQGEIAGNVGRVLEAKTPLAGVRTPEQLEAVAREKQPQLGQYFENRIREAQAAIGGNAVTLRVPALTVPGSEEIVTQYGKMPASMLGLGSDTGRLTLPEASQQLAALRQLAYGGGKNDPTTRTIAGRDARKLYGEALKQINDELLSHNPAAAEAWNDGRKAMAVGGSIIDLLQKSGVFKREPDAVKLDTGRLQALLSTHRGWLKERMGPDEFAALTKAVIPGGRLGMADVGTRFVGAPLNTTVNHPVDLPQIMINASVNRMLRQ